MRDSTGGKNRNSTKLFVIHEALNLSNTALVHRGVWIYICYIN